MERQDRQGARTVTDLERKYNLRNFGKQFAEVMGIATDARNTAEAVDEKLDKELLRIETKIEETNEGIFLRIEELENGVTADLSLVVFKDDYDQVVSMINASADVIRLTSGRLVVESDNFALDENGLVSIGFGDGKGFINTDTHYFLFPDFEVRKLSDGGLFDSYVSIKKAMIGCAGFSTATNKVGIGFEDRGAVLVGERVYPFIWEDGDNIDIFKMRGDEQGLHLEHMDYGNGNLDLFVFGQSFKGVVQLLEDVELRLAKVEQTLGGGGSDINICDILGHDFEDGSCTRCGDPDPDYDVLRCSECGEVLVEEVLWHDDPTCTTEGWDCYGCANCGAGTRDVSLGYDPDNHDYVLVATEPKNDGTYVDVFECSRCGAIEERPH